AGQGDAAGSVGHVDDRLAASPDADAGEPAERNRLSTGEQQGATPDGQGAGAGDGEPARGRVVEYQGVDRLSGQAGGAGADSDVVGGRRPGVGGELGRQVERANAADRVVGDEAVGDGSVAEATDGIGQDADRRAAGRPAAADQGRGAGK